MEEILKSVLNGLDFGDINHSSELHSNFMSFVSEKVTERPKGFFSSCLDHAGCKPPVNLQADKGKNAHRTRQFTSVVTVASESPKLLTHIYIGQPVFKSHHDGPGVTQSLIDEFNSWDIQRDQVEGGSFGQQFFHLSVLAHLTEVPHLPNQFISTRDPLHKGGVVDNHIREDSSFSWLVEIQTVCSEISSTFNCGKEVTSAKKSDDEETNKLQVTRSANRVRFVFINLRIDY